MTFLKKIKQFYFSKILKRKYFRCGACSRCGACCSSIYIKHKNNVIKTQDEFETLKANDDYPFWNYLNIISKDDLGLVFECMKYDKINKICTIHKKRPSICRKYPSEEIFSMGAELKEGCGYKFIPIYSFGEIMDKISKKAK